jgi:hypothetical protein
MLELMIMYAEYDLELHNFFTKNFNWKNKRISDLISNEHVICLNTPESLRKARERFDDIRTIHYSYYDEEKTIEITDFENHKIKFKNARVCGEYIRREPISEIFKDVNVLMLREKMSAEDYLLYEAQFNEFGINIVPEKQYFSKSESENKIFYKAFERMGCDMQWKNNEIIFLVNNTSINMQDFFKEISNELKYTVEVYDDLSQRNRALLDENGEVTKELKEKLTEVEEIFKKMLAK